MKKRVDYYPYYEKLIGMKLDELIAEAPEYEDYASLKKWIRLKWR